MQMSKDEVEAVIDPLDDACRACLIREIQR